MRRTWIDLAQSVFNIVTADSVALRKLGGKKCECRNVCLICGDW